MNVKLPPYVTACGLNRPEIILKCPREDLDVELRVLCSKGLKPCKRLRIAFAKPEADLQVSPSNAFEDATDVFEGRKGQRERSVGLRFGVRVLPRTGKGVDKIKYR